MIESGELDSDFSRLFDLRSEEINQYLKNVSISPIDVKQKQLNAWTQNGQFDPSKLDFYGEEKKLATEAVINCLKHICFVSNSNLVRNADSLLSRRKEDVPVDWIGASKVRAPAEKFKVSS